MQSVAVPLFPVQQGYDKAAEMYDQWHWAHFWRKNERPVVSRWIEGLRPGLFLDAGSGTGGYRLPILKSGQSCLALDVSINMLKVQRRNLACLGIPNGGMIQADVTSLPLEASTFDYALCARVLSHVDRLAGALAELARVTKPGGELMLTDVHPEHPYERVTVSNGCRIGIQVFKHSMDELLSAITGVRQLRLAELREYSLCDLIWKPPTERFGSIYSAPHLPIFYTCRISRV